MKYFSHYTRRIGIAAAMSIGVAGAILTTPKAPTITLNNELLTAQTRSPIGAARIGVGQGKSGKTGDKITPIVTCIGQCQRAFTLLTNSVIIDDDTYEGLSVLTADLAAYLETNYGARQDMLGLAQSTQDGNKRALIIEAFKLLPAQHREELGHVLATSQHWQLRADAISILSSPDVMSLGGAKALIKTFRDEPNDYVKTVMLAALKNSQALKGEPAILGYLSLTMQTETDSAVRSSAMLTKLALQEDPHSSMDDALLALGSGDVEFQYSAFIALGGIYESDSLVDGGLDRIDHEAIRRALEAFMDSEVTPENASEMKRLLMEADLFYERHFLEN